jgi:hypothetical protein
LIKNNFSLDTIASTDHSDTSRDTTGVSDTRREQAEVRGRPLRRFSLKSISFPHFFMLKPPLYYRMQRAGALELILGQPGAILDITARRYCTSIYVETSCFHLDGHG